MNGKSNDYSNATKDERKQMVEKIYVQYPRANNVRGAMEHCRQHSKIAAEPECMMLLGVRGSGKTTECKKYAQGFPRDVTGEKTILPVLYASIPSPTTTKSLPMKLLYSLGDPFWKNGNTTVQTLRLCGLLEDCGTEIIILDEFHNFIDGKTDRAILEISNWLKDFLNEAKKPIIVAGLPYCDVVLQANDQLERRFTVRKSLSPLGWKTAKQKATFKDFLKYVDSRLPFEERSNLDDEELAYKFYCATNGVIDFIVKIIRRAAELAIDRNMDKLDLHVLARAYKDRLVTIEPNRPNPFTIDNEQLKIKPFRESILGLMATNSRLKAKKRVPSLTEIFSRR
jgi:Cdc6-like AAA superfamily ATPase